LGARPGRRRAEVLRTVRADRPARAREPDLVAEALAVCQEIIDDCRATGVPVVIENLGTRCRARSWTGARGRTPSSKPPAPSTTSTSTCSSWSTRVRRAGAAASPRSSTVRGPSCRRACRSPSSVTSCGSPSTRAAPPASSRVVPCGARRSAWTAPSARMFLSDVARHGSRSSPLGVHLRRPWHRCRSALRLALGHGHLGGRHGRLRTIRG
jgi:hypothetical protein